MKRIALAAVGVFFLVSASVAFAETPDVPQCRGILTPAMREVAREAKDDPAKAYKKKHRKLSKEVACESALWKALQPSTKLSDLGRRALSRALGTGGTFPSFPVIDDVYNGPYNDPRPVHRSEEHTSEL